MASTWRKFLECDNYLFCDLIEAARYLAVVQNLVEACNQTFALRARGCGYSRLPPNRGTGANDVKKEEKGIWSTITNPSNEYAEHSCQSFKCTFNQAEIGLLSKGLIFCPRPPIIVVFLLRVDLQQRSRRLRLKDFFADKERNDNEYNPFKNKSNWTPPQNRNPALEAYIKL